MSIRIDSVALLATVSVVLIGLLLLASSARNASAQEPTPTVTELTPPAAPDLLSANGTMTWADNSDNEDGFRLYVTVNGQENVFEVGPDVTIFEIPEGVLTGCGKAEYYYLGAFNVAGETGSTTAINSDVDCFLGVELEILPPAAPDLVEFDDRLRWIDNSDNEDGFRVYLTVNGEENVFVVGEDVTVFEYPEGLIPSCGTTDYELTAFNIAGETRATSSSFLISDCFIFTSEPEVLPVTGGHAVGGERASSMLAATLFAAGLVLLCAAGTGWRLDR